MSQTASKSVLLRLTPDEHSALTALSQETGLSLSRLVVSRVLGGAGSPASEVARARAALQAALKALDGDEAVEAVVTTPVIEPDESVAPVEVPEVEVPVIVPVPDEPAPVEDEVDDLADLVEPKVRRPRRTPEVVQITQPPGGGAPVWVQRVEKVSAHYSGSLTDPRRIFGVRVVATDYSLPGTLYCALLGTTTLVVGQAVGGEVVWSESLSWRQADRAATLDRVKVLAKRS